MTTITEISVSELEWSVRTGNVLKHMGINTIGELMELTRQQVLAAPNAGVKTWNEIHEMQRSMTPPSPGEVVMMLERLAVRWNEIADLAPDNMTIEVDGKHLVIVRRWKP